jgi:nitroreductase
MEALEAIKTRKSVRAFRPDPIPREVLQKIMEAPQYASSWANSQPWEFAVLGGKVMEEVRELLGNKPPRGEDFLPDYTYASFSGACQERFMSLNRQMWEAFGATLGKDEDTERIMRIMRRNFEAPHMIIAYLDRSLESISLLDLGAAIQLITLTAHTYGVGCCVMASTVGYPNDLRRILGIPDTKKLIVGIAMGYPDPQSPLNKINREREALENYTTWYGLD